VNPRVDADIAAARRASTSDGLPKIAAALKLGISRYRLSCQTNTAGAATRRVQLNDVHDGQLERTLRTPRELDRSRRSNPRRSALVGGNIACLRGVWPDALHEAVLACERLSEPAGQPAFAAALYQLAELHRLRGEFEEAEAAYRKTAECGRSPYPGRALLRLAQGRRRNAAAAIGRLLRETRGRRARSKILGAAIEIMLACGDSATLELAAACRIFEQLGARPDLERVKTAEAAHRPAAG
jgi:hypothetical protein